jgi:hypothetical protein
VLLELSEHDPVEDYDTLRRSLAPLRQRGLRLAIDDVGAGFSSLRHIVVTTPDVIKLDRSLVDGVTDDPVLRTLVRSLVDFGHGFEPRWSPRASRPPPTRPPCSPSTSTSARAGTSAARASGRPRRLPAAGDPFG